MLAHTHLVIRVEHNGSLWLHNLERIVHAAAAALHQLHRRALQRNDASRLVACRLAARRHIRGLRMHSGAPPRTASDSLKKYSRLVSTKKNHRCCHLLPNSPPSFHSLPHTSNDESNGDFCMRGQQSARARMSCAHGGKQPGAARSHPLQVGHGALQLGCEEPKARLQLLDSLLCNVQLRVHRVHRSLHAVNHLPLTLQLRQHVHANVPGHVQVTQRRLGGQLLRLLLLSHQRAPGAMFRHACRAWGVQLCFERSSGQETRARTCAGRSLSVRHAAEARQRRPGQCESLRAAAPVGKSTGEVPQGVV